MSQAAVTFYNQQYYFLKYKALHLHGVFLFSSTTDWYGFLLPFPLCSLSLLRDWGAFVAVDQPLLICATVTIISPLISPQSRGQQLYCADLCIVLSTNLNWWLHPVWTKQAPHAWFHKYRTAILRTQFYQSPNDNLIFLQHIICGCTILLYVNDMIISGNDVVGNRYQRTQRISYEPF